MKARIAVISERKLIIYCDGKKLDFVGNQQIVNSLRSIRDDKTSFYNQMKKDLGADFDPVEYFVNSSMNFATDIFDYSEQRLKDAKEEISNAS